MALEKINKNGAIYNKTNQKRKSNHRNHMVIWTDERKNVLRQTSTSLQDTNPKGVRHGKNTPKYHKCYLK